MTDWDKLIEAVRKAAEKEFELGFKAGQKAAFNDKTVEATFTSPGDALFLEVLIDIRDLLANPPKEITGDEKGTITRATLQVASPLSQGDKHE